MEDALMPKGLHPVLSVAATLAQVPEDGSTRLHQNVGVAKLVRQRLDLIQQRAVQRGQVVLVDVVGVVAAVAENLVEKRANPFTDKLVPHVLSDSRHERD